MKTNYFNSFARKMALTVALAFAAGMTVSASAQEGAKGGATKLLELSGQGIEKPVAASTYKPMSCSMCNNEITQKVDRTARGANKPVILVAKHLCPHCGTEWSTTGHGKAKVTVAKHTCAPCAAM